VKYQIRVRWLAERDLEEAEDWYDEQRPGLGAEFRQTIADLFARLAANPQIYPKVHGEIRRAVLRRFPYLVYFLIEDTKVIILGVLDSRRDPEIHRRRTGA
jgi:toxin ParE1/3/4